MQNLNVPSKTSEGADTASTRHMILEGATNAEWPRAAEKAESKLS